MRNRFGFAAAACLMISLPVAASAQWTTNGALVCGAANAQSNPIAVPDGAGGAIIVWVDPRSDAGDIYAQRVDGAGASLWTSGGVPLCNATGAQVQPFILEDGAGGAVVAWEDYRGGSTSDIYAQRVDGSGAVQWTANGVAVSSAAQNQLTPSMTSGSAGGVIVTWTDYRSGAADIYAARVSASGVVVDATGIVVSNAGSDQYFPVAAPYGTGGAVIAWQDYRTQGTTSADIYAARMTGTGTVVDVSGLGICKNGSYQGYPAVVSDGSGGAVFAWSDFRAIEGIYAQRIDSAGGALWAIGGVPVSGPLSGAYFLYPRMIGDGAGGAFLSWTSAAGADYNLFAQRIDGTGAPQWLPNETIVSGAANVQSNHSMARDAAGDLVMAWMDDRDVLGEFDIYAQRVNPSGVVQWQANGVRVCDAVNDQSLPWVVSDGSGGAIVAWADSRSNAAGTQDDIYAQRVLANGDTPTPVSSPPPAAFTVLPARPNPFAGATDVDVRLQSPSEVGVDVFDVAGRRVRTMSLRDSRAGWHRVSFDGRDDHGVPLPSGVYFLRIGAAGTSRTQKIVVVR